MDERKMIDVKEDILSQNSKEGDALRSALQKQGVYMVNVMASPGSGKTTTILATIAALKEKLKFGVIEGDIESMVDSHKVRDAGTPAVQIQTGGACHLDVPMVEPALKLLDLEHTDCVFVENIGNLVCPAEFDIGEDLRLMILSVPEGDDKVLKYPLMFSVCDVLIVNKTDFLALPTNNFNMKALYENVHRLSPDIKIFEMSSYTGDGVAAWADWLYEQVTARQHGQSL